MGNMTLSKHFPKLCCNGGSCGNCCLGYCCPCVASGKISEASGADFCQGCLIHCCITFCLGNCCSSFYHTCWPSKNLREKYPTGVEESDCKICICHLCCPGCARSRAHLHRQPS